MKKYAVDVPVCIMVWTRPNLQRITFEPIKQARPSVLFLISDGPRNEDERIKIEESRNIVCDINWECTVYKLFLDENQGMYSMGSQMYEFVFSHVDRCIFLEDDVLASISFFEFCADLLEKYKNDERFTAINGTNNLGNYDECEEDYFFTLYNSITGFALWKRTYDLFNSDCFNDASLAKTLDNYAKTSDYIAKSVNRIYKGYQSDAYFQNHPAGPEFYRSFINITHSQLDIVPKKNLITNLGLSAEATHTKDIRLLPKREQRLFNQKRYELELPLKHPNYVIRDLIYEKRCSPPVFWEYIRKIDVIYRNIRYLTTKELLGKIKRKLNKSRNIEK